MKTISQFHLSAHLALVLIMGLGATFVPLQAAQQPQPDNTRANKQDTGRASPTADQQKSNASDTAITKKIRAAIHNDASLSTYAHNVKIITQSGKVTLKGPVRSEDEKKNIAMKATAVVGEGNVDNQLDIAAEKR